MSLFALTLILICVPARGYRAQDNQLLLDDQEEQQQDEHASALLQNTSILELFSTRAKPFEPTSLQIICQELRHDSLAGPSCTSEPYVVT
eukprot:TRINITY_DN34497_c0_g2_i1.p1 TRINITY_DN34497_c0_g2~~TRINITY_DN34497_c0_g2_i1.p1  ORF type:complete len:103 (-),score=4.41 TRINITY_DN34497_c0_g2_i1:36-305(-)